MTEQTLLDESRFWVAVDTAIFTLCDRDLKTLLVRRDHDPFAGLLGAARQSGSRQTNRWKTPRCASLPKRSTSAMFTASSCTPLATPTATHAAA